MRIICDQLVVVANVYYLQPNFFFPSQMLYEKLGNIYPINYAPVLQYNLTYITMIFCVFGFRKGCPDAQKINIAMVSLEST